MSFWRSIVSSVAPVIGTALGGPMGGAAMKAVADGLFPGEDVPEKDLEKRLEAELTDNPEALAKLRQINNEFAVRMRELDIDLEQINLDHERMHAADRASARDLQGNTKSWSVPILAGLTVAGFFAVVAFVLSGQVTLESTLLGFVLGQVSAKAEQVYNFYFGSSKGSKDKTEAMAAAGARK